MQSHEFNKTHRNFKKGNHHIEEMVINCEKYQEKQLYIWRSFIDSIHMFSHRIGTWSE